VCEDVDISKGVLKEKTANSVDLTTCTRPETFALQYPKVSHTTAVVIQKGGISRLINTFSLEILPHLQQRCLFEVQQGARSGLHVFRDVVGQGSQVVDNLDRGTFT
jgi:hypothetical protein